MPKAGKHFYFEEMTATDPNKNDVLCGRGGLVYKHNGNVAFRRVVEANKSLYHSCPPNHKILLARSIVEAIARQEPSGRYLVEDKNTKEWFDIGKQKAIHKTCQALRENADEIRKKLEAKAALLSLSKATLPSAENDKIKKEEEEEFQKKIDAKTALLALARAASNEMMIPRSNNNVSVNLERQVKAETKVSDNNNANNDTNVGDVPRSNCTVSVILERLKQVEQVSDENNEEHLKKDDRKVSMESNRTASTNDTRLEGMEMVPEPVTSGISIWVPGPDGKKIGVECV